MGHGRLSREAIYERVSREQWCAVVGWQELEWVAVCHDCAAGKERAKRRQGEVTVLDVKKEMERTQTAEAAEEEAGRTGRVGQQRRGRRGRRRWQRRLLACQPLSASSAQR